jgi:hypothetical protein
MPGDILAVFRQPLKALFKKPSVSALVAVLLDGFVKKSQDMPKEELAVAKARLSQIRKA